MQFDAAVSREIIKAELAARVAMNRRAPSARMDGEVYSTPMVAPADRAHDHVRPWGFGFAEGTLAP
jgi:hypothetical protein